MRLEGQREKKERKKKATPVPTKTSKDNTTVIDDVEVGGKPTLTMFLPSARQSPPPPASLQFPLGGRYLQDQDRINCYREDKPLRIKH